ncbi:MAG TPA: hypothetical protein VLV86_03390 [Vicinamibacterales bacterium]|nr:hypothetical protein [Vicinamibacterales bacterium]
MTNARATHRLADLMARLAAEITDGLRHGYFEFTLTCEVVAGNRRRLVFKAGKSHQFVIPEDECVGSRDFPHGSAIHDNR